MDADLGATITSNIHGGMSRPADTASSVGGATVVPDDIKQAFKSFLQHFCVGKVFVYAEMLRRHLAADMQFIEVDVVHVQSFSETLSQQIINHPTRAIPRLEEAAAELAKEQKLFAASVVRPEIQAQIFWSVAPVGIRQLALSEVARLVVTSGIVIKANSSSARCTRATIQCSSCRSKTVVAGGKSVDMPPQCVATADRTVPNQPKCRPNPYVLLPQECMYEDQQVLKLQELPEDVPTSELPRHINVVVDRYLVDKITPGTRIHVAGVISVQEKRSTEKRQGGAKVAAGLRAQYLRCVGIMTVGGKAADGATSVMSVNHNYSSKVRSRTATGWQAEDEAAFKRFAKERNVYETIAECIDPAIFGAKDQKRAIACLLFGGSRKKAGNNYLRGDMNVLFIGDPSTAKSQLLKFTEKVAPIAIYTSGKGSSAAGLTASVVGNGGEFWLEAGAMVLADGGVVCIDEFDKMREQDQVAIHEAMEQQTISIAKANLTTMLNSRTSVLAAANPTMGSYDPLQSNEDQMDFQSSILSRFDLIFKVLDPKDVATDKRLAAHVIRLHGLNGGGVQEVRSPVPLPFLTKYIAYARNTCRPQISEEAMATLLDFFVQIRKESHALTTGANASGSSSSGKGSAPLIQITARQLESLVRCTESLAKMRLDTLATVEDAEEAIRLFKVATVDAINSGVMDNSMTEEQSEVVLKIEEAIRRRMAIGATVQHTRLSTELSRMGFESRLVDRAFYSMMRREELEWRKQRTLVYRNK